MWVRVSIALILGLSLLACGDPQSRRHPADLTQPQQGGTLIYATDREPLCLDPQSLGDMPQVFIAAQFLDSLVSMDEHGRIGPWLAKSWEISADGRTYTFHLRDDVHFTDGTPFTAAAVKANLDHMLDPKTLSSTARNYIEHQYERTDLIDEHTAAVHLFQPYAPFLEVLSQGFLGIESPAALQRPEEANCELPIGSGPFKVVHWYRQNQVVLERNPDYAWAPPTARHQGPAYLDKILWKFVPEASVRFATLQAGMADVIDALPPEDHTPARSNPDITLIIHSRPGNPTHGSMNTTREPFDDVRVREAFVRAANVNGALRSVFFGEFPRAGGPLSAGTPFYSDAFESAQSYDPRRSNQLLDAAGWNQRDADHYRAKAGHRLTVRVPLALGVWSDADRALWEQVQSSARKVGFTVDLEPMSEAETRLRTGAEWDYDVRPGYWNTNTPDVLRFLFGSEFVKGAVYHANGTGFANPELDDLLERALRTVDPSARQSLYTRAQALISQQYLQLTLYPQSTRLAVYKTAHGVRLEPSLTIPTLYDAWVTK